MLCDALGTRCRTASSLNPNSCFQQSCHTCRQVNLSLECGPVFITFTYPALCDHANTFRRGKRLAGMQAGAGVHPPSPVLLLVTTPILSDRCLGWRAGRSQYSPSHQGGVHQGGIRGPVAAAGRVAEAAGQEPLLHPSRGVQPPGLLGVP